MCLALPERMQIGELTLRWTTLGKVLGNPNEGFPLDEGLRMKDEGLDGVVDEGLKIKDEGLNSVVDEGLRIKDEGLNSPDSDTSETKVISPSSCVLHPSSQESPSSCVLHPSSQGSPCSLFLAP
ncbi:MAG: hypothetical protein ACI4UO_07395, partial [Paludibacteraceae bacterium]